MTTIIKVPDYKVGDYILLNTISNNKLKPNWKGPYEIISLSPNIANMTIKGQNGKHIKVHYNRVKRAPKSMKLKSPKLLTGYSLRPRTRQ